MDYLALIAAGFLGIWLGYKFALKKRGLIIKQAREKKENKKKILELLKEKGKATNNDVEALLNVSDATASRYLSELEREGEIKQHGETGRDVFYTLKQ